MLSLFTGGMYCNLLQIFTLDELIMAGSFAVMLGYAYVKAEIKVIKNKKIEQEFKKLELANKEKAITNIKNVNVSKLFK
jgi:hypothetical protein